MTINIPRHSEPKGEESELRSNGERMRVSPPQEPSSFLSCVLDFLHEKQSLISQLRSFAMFFATSGLHYRFALRKSAGVHVILSPLAKTFAGCFCSLIEKRYLSRVHSAEKNNPVNYFSRGGQGGETSVKTRLLRKYQDEKKE